MLAAELSGYWAPVVIGLAGSTGFTGFLLALVKLRGDTDSQAVSQAQGAMETMQALNEALEDDRDYWRSRYEECHSKRNELLARVLELERAAPR